MNPLYKNCLTPSEINASNGVATLRSEAIKGKRYQDLLKSMLFSKAPALDDKGMPLTDEEGNVCLSTLAEQLTASKLAYMLQHPESYRLEEITKALGENKAQVEQADDSSDFFSFMPKGKKEVIDIEVEDDTEDR